MKRINVFLSTIFVVTLLVFSSCTKRSVVVVAPKNAPPGQVKKATGSQSAKTFAPGQQQQKKKH